MSLKTSDLTWLPSRTKNPLYPLLTSCNTSSISALKDRQLYLGPVLVQILRPYLRRRPFSGYYYVSLQRRPLDTLQLPWLYCSLNWECLVQHLDFAITNLCSSQAIKALGSFT
jgi:hypothetical protein